MRRVCAFTMLASYSSWLRLWHSLLRTFWTHHQKTSVYTSRPKSLSLYHLQRFSSHWVSLWTCWLMKVKNSSEWWWVVTIVHPFQLLAAIFTPDIKVRSLKMSSYPCLELRLHLLHRTVVSKVHQSSRVAFPKLEFSMSQKFRRLLSIILQKMIIILFYESKETEENQILLFQEWVKTDCRWRT